MAIRARSILKPRGGVLLATLPAMVATGSGSAVNPAYAASLVASMPLFVALGSGSFAGTATYPERPVTHVASPTQTGSGHTGSEADPFSPEDLINFNPNGQYFHARLRGGFWDTAAVHPARAKYGYFGPRHHGTAANPIIWSGRDNPNTPGADDYPRFRRTGGRGGILGVFNRNYFECDRFSVDTWTNEPYGETFQVSGWYTRGTKFTRGRINGEGAGVVTEDSTNCGGVYFQQHFDCLVQDCVIEDIGSASGQQIWSAIEHYSGDNFRVINNTIRRVRGYAIFEKGVVTDGTANRANRFLRNHVHDIRRRALFQYTHFSGTNLLDASWWAQNIVHDVAEQCAWINPPVRPEGTSGVVMINNLFAFAGFAGLAWRWSSDISPAFHPMFIFRNNIFHGCARNIDLEFNTWAVIAAANAQFDRNLYSAYGTHYADSDGTRAYGSWRGLSGYLGQPNDEHGLDTDPQFVDAGARNFRLQSGSPARNAGTDYLQLLGGSSSAPINIGPFITPGMTDQIGCRADV